MCQLAWAMEYLQIVCDNFSRRDKDFKKKERKKIKRSASSSHQGENKSFFQDLNETKSSKCFLALLELNKLPNIDTIVVIYFTLTHITNYTPLLLLFLTQSLIFRAGQTLFLLLLHPSWIHIVICCPFFCLLASLLGISSLSFRIPEKSLIGLQF